MKTLKEVRDFIQEESKILDPESRYITELLETVNQAKDVPTLLRLLGETSRGRFWAGEHAWEWMSTEEKLRSNLITNETSMMRFEHDEIRFLRRILKAYKKKSLDVLSIPCSHGEEAVSIAIECKEAGLQDFMVRGYDIQEACIEVARSGKIPLSGLPGYVTGIVNEAIRRHTEFFPGDILKEIPTGEEMMGPLPKTYDLVVCRNFLGYFKPDVIRKILRKLESLTKDPGFLMVDTFVLTKYPRLFKEFPSLRNRTDPFFEKNSRVCHESAR